RAESARTARARVVHQRGQLGERDLLRSHAEALAAARQQAHALLLEQRAALHLAAQDAREAHDRVDVARTDGGALLEHDLQQPARGVDLLGQVGEHLRRERLVVHDALRREQAGRAHGTRSDVAAGTPPLALGAVSLVCAMPRVSWAASPRPPSPMIAPASACGASALIPGSELEAPSSPSAPSPSSPPAPTLEESEL